MFSTRNHENTQITIPPRHTKDEKGWKHDVSSKLNSNSEDGNDWFNHKQWLSVFGTDIIVNLFSPDWELRELAVQSLSREIVSAILDITV